MQIKRDTAWYGIQLHTEKPFPVPTDEGHIYFPRRELFAQIVLCGGAAGAAEEKIGYLYGDTADKLADRWYKRVGAPREKLSQIRITIDGPCVINRVAHAAGGSGFVYIESFGYLGIIVRGFCVAAIGIPA